MGPDFPFTQSHCYFQRCDSWRSMGNTDEVVQENSMALEIARLPQESAQSWGGGQRRVGWKRIIMKRWYSIHRSPINMVTSQKCALTVFSEHMVSGLSALKWKQSWRRGSCHFLVKSLLRIFGKQSGPIILHSQDFVPLGKTLMGEEKKILTVTYI